MKKINGIVLSVALLGVLILSVESVRAQNGASDLAKFLQTSQQGQDASKLIQAYCAPVVRAASYGMTGGWYHTAKTHNKFGVDIGVTINTVFFPTSDNYFDPTKIGLSANTTFTNTTHPGMGSPTFVGPKDNTTYTTSVNGLPVSFVGPEGLDMKKSIGIAALPVPMIQLGIGLVFNTDLKIRYLPQYTNAGNKVQMLGFGLMHDIKQHIPGVKLLPFDLSVLVAYNSITGSTDLRSQNPSGNRPTSDDGQVKYKLNSWVGQLVVSKKVSVLTGYLGVGYGAVASNVDVTGTFNIGNTAAPILITNPASIKVNANTPKLTAGIRLKFGPIYLVGDYTLQKYNSLAIGIGVSVR